MPRRFFFSSLATETNTFSNIPTALEDFEIQRGSEMLAGPGASTYVKGIATALSLEDAELVVGLSAQAPPGAATQRAAYEMLRGEILRRLAEAAPIDAVLLVLHGAMVAYGYLDCEGDLLARVRKLVGPNIPVGVVLDPHAHLTPEMVENADVMAFMKEYPHTDLVERTRDVVRILLQMLDRGVRPVPAVYDCRMIGFFPTQFQPMRGFVDRMIQREGRDGVLTTSFIHGFAYGDTPNTGAKILVYTDGNPEKAAAVAAELHREIWAIKDQTTPAWFNVGEAIAEMALPRSRPLVVADFADNPGGGAPSDSTFLLRAAVEACLAGVAFGLFFDPEAVRMCHAVGVGGRLELRVGGKVGRFSGQPIDLDVEVLGLAKDARMGNMAGEDGASIGDTAWVRSGGIDIVLNTIRKQLLHPEGLSHIGIDPEKCSAIVVKSSNHFAANFAPIADKVIYVGGPGALDLDVARLPYRNFTRPFYPRVANPFAADDAK
jgi:microcystin degradation protein MlrC